MRIELENGIKEDQPSSRRISELLHSLERSGNSFAILAEADQHYVQTALIDGGYVIEKRLGSVDQHFEGIRAESLPVNPETTPWWKFWQTRSKADCFPADVVVDVFLAFAGEGSEPDGLSWRPATHSWMG